MAARKTASKGGKPDKLMRDALSLELHQEQEAEIDGVKQKVKRLRLVAKALVDNAIGGDTASIKEINDRMDGKVPQAIVGDDESDPIRMDRPTDEQLAKAMADFITRTKHTLRK